MRNFGLRSYCIIPHFCTISPTTFLFFGYYFPTFILLFYTIFLPENIVYVSNYSSCRTDKIQNRKPQIFFQNAQMCLFFGTHFYNQIFKLPSARTFVINYPHNGNYPKIWKIIRISVKLFKTVTLDLKIRNNNSIKNCNLYFNISSDIFIIFIEIVKIFRVGFLNQTSKFSIKVPKVFKIKQLSKIFKA